MRKITLIAVLAIFGVTMVFAGCQKKGSAEKSKPATEHNENDGHDHSSHSKDDGHGH